MAGALARHSANAEKTQSRAQRRAAAANAAERALAEARMLDAAEKNARRPLPLPKLKLPREPETISAGKAPKSSLAANTRFPGALCALCGKRVPPGDMLLHKESVHGEMQVVPSPTLPHKSGQWMSLCSGGLPSLGKRNR